MSIEIAIENLDHFVFLSRQFDKKYQTCTYYIKLTLEDVWQNFLLPSKKDIRWWAKTSKEYNHQILSRKINEIFDEETIKFSLKHNLPEDKIGKIYSMFLMKKDIIEGKGLIDPICVSVFNNGNNPIHPGGTRLNFANIYKEPMHVIVTEYKRKLNLPYLPLEEFSFDFENSNFFFMVGNSIKDKDKWISYRKAAENNNVTFKQIQNIHKDYQKFLHPNTNENNIKFELYKENLFVNDTLLAIKNKNNMWEITLDV